jgi:hypothetical protein
MAPLQKHFTTRKFLLPPHVSFSPSKNPILPPKISVNTSRIFKNFGFYLLKFCDIETGVSTVYKFWEP